ncbi:MAG: carboxypeptidase-like regulatory domain-containing protein, partial [Deltaproteobacteria bacterium]
GKSATTGSDGSYSITDISAGSQTLAFSKTGYQAGSKSVTITAGQNTNAGDSFLQKIVSSFWKSDDCYSSDTFFYLELNISDNSFTGKYDSYLKVYCTPSVGCYGCKYNTNTPASGTIDFVSNTGYLKVPSVGESAFTITSLSATTMKIVLSNPLIDNKFKYAYVKKQ